MTPRQRINAEIERLKLRREKSTDPETCAQLSAQLQRLFEERRTLAFGDWTED